MDRRYRYLLAGLTGVAVPAVVVVTVALVLAVDGDDGPEPTTIATAGPSPPREASTPEPASTAFVLPTPWARGDQVPLLPPNGVWVVEAASGERTVLYESDDRLYTLLVPGIDFTPSDDAVWLSPMGSGGSARVALDGTIEESIAGGWGVVQSPYGPTRTYWLIEDGVLTRRLAVEHGGAVFELPGRIALPAFDPQDRWFAYVDFDNPATPFGRTGTLRVLDLRTGAARVLATGIDPCECDGTPGPVWSPSGRYVTYVDFGNKVIEADGSVTTGDDAGTYVVELASGAVQHLSQNPRDFAFSPWLPGEDTLVMTRGGTVSLLDVAAGEERVLAEFEGDAVAQTDPLRRGLTVVVTPLEPPYSTTIVALGLPDGREVDRWHDNGLVVWTEDGPAVAINAYRSGALACGVIVDHPALGEERCIEGTLDGRWSSDGRYLALFGRAREGEYVGDEYHEWWRVTILDTLDGHLTIIGDDQLPSQPTIRWNSASTHFLVIWPSGL